MATPSEIKLHFNKVPSPLLAYWRAFVLPRQGIKPDLVLPKIEGTINQVNIDPNNLGRYEKICGFKHSTNLPITYPHLLAMPLHAQILTSPHFPIRPLGLVHIRNSITQYRPILKKEPLKIECLISGGTFTEKGFEFDLTTQIQIKKKNVWASTSTFLAPHKQKVKGKETPPQKRIETRPPKHRVFWDLPENCGRQYACVSGDINPIHLFAATAKLFGFPRAIAHGMWSLARVASTITDKIGINSQTMTLIAAFKLPIYLPNTILLEHEALQQGIISFQLTDKQGEKPHLVGTLNF